MHRAKKPLFFATIKKDLFGPRKIFLTQLEETLPIWNIIKGLNRVLITRHITHYRGVARIFKGGGGGHTASNNIVMAFSPRNIVGCLLEKGLRRGVTGTPGPPSYAPPLQSCKAPHNNKNKNNYISPEIIVINVVMETGRSRSNHIIGLSEDFDFVDDGYYFVFQGPNVFKFVLNHVLNLYICQLNLTHNMVIISSNSQNFRNGVLL